MNVQLHSVDTVYDIEYAGVNYRVHKYYLKGNCNGLPVYDYTIFCAGKLVQDVNIFNFMKNAIEEHEKAVRI